MQRKITKELAHHMLELLKEHPKEKVECAVCHEMVEVIIGGYIRLLEIHGPNREPCPGSGKTPDQNRRAFHRPL